LDELGVSKLEGDSHSSKLEMDSPPHTVTSHQGFKLSSELDSKTWWTAQYPGVFLEEHEEGGQWLVTNPKTTASFQISRDFATNGAQKLRVLFTIPVTEGRLKVVLYDRGCEKIVASHYIDPTTQCEGTFDFHAPGKQMFSFIIYNDVADQVSKCHVKKVQIFLEEGED